MFISGWIRIKRENQNGMFVAKRMKNVQMKNDKEAAMKKLTKELVSVVLAVVMVLSMTCTVFAANEPEPEIQYTITIENSVKDQTYEVYKIFDATYDDEGAVAYTISAESPWYDVITGNHNNDIALEIGADIFTLYPIEVDEEGEVITYQVVTNEGVSEDEIIDFIASCKVPDGAEAIATETGNGGTLTINVDDPGYYFITTTTGSAVSVTTAAPEATIIDKNLAVSVEKHIIENDEEKDAVSDGMGENVNFDVKAEVPKYEDDNYVVDYTLTDSLSNGLLIELNEEEFYQGNDGKYYLYKDMINTWITLFDGAGNELSFTENVYKYSFELVGYDTYKDATSGENVHTFSGFVLTYYTFDYDKYYDDYMEALKAEGGSWPGDIPEGFDFPAESYFDDSLYPANASIEIKYTAHVTSLEGYDNTNDITLKHEITPFSHPQPLRPETGEQYDDHNDVYSWELDVLKISGDGSKTPLERATFTLTSDDMKDVAVGHSYLYVSVYALNDALENYDGIYTDEQGNNWKVADFETTDYIKDGDDYVVGTGSSSLETYHRILTDKTAEGVDTQELTVQGTTDANGKLLFEGLGTGTFTLTEIEAPDGYNLLEDPIVIIVSFDEETGTFTVQTGDSTLDGGHGFNFGEMDNGIFEITLENNAGSILPGTGGMGTTLFYIIGAILVCGAVVLLVSRRRMHSAE